MRTFQSPSGRRWTVTLYELPSGVAIARARDSLLVSSVLRFEADDIILDLVDFPAKWEELSDDALIGLLRRATLPAFAPIGLHAPARPPLTPPIGLGRDEQPIRC